MLSYFVIFFIIILLYLLTLTMVKPRNYPPGPVWFPLIGCYKQFRDVYSKKRYYHLLWAYFHELYGPVTGLKLGSSKIVIVSGHDAVKEVLSRKDFEGRPDGFFYRLRSFGKRLGVVFVDGPLMQEQKNFCYQKLKLSGLGKATINDVVTKEALEVVNLITTECEKGPIEVQRLFEVSTLNTIWAMITGERFHLRDEKLLKLLNLVHNGFRLVDMTGGLLNQMPFLRFVAPSWSGYNFFSTIVLEITEFLQNVVKKHRENDSECNFITKFLQEVANNKNNINTSFTEKQLIVLLEDFFMAGSETTSSTLSFIIIYLIKYPQVQRKIHSELDRVLGFDEIPKMEHKDNLVYLMATIMEVQRLGNPVPLSIPHRATEDTKLLNYKIPKDTFLIPSLWSVHMDKNYWDDPFEFKPERFINEEGKLHQNGTHFIPFGIGKRRCMGEILARTTLFLFLAMILQKFRIEASTDNFSVEILDGVNLSPAPFEVNFIPRKSQLILNNTLRKE